MNVNSEMVAADAAIAFADVGRGLVLRETNGVFDMELQTRTETPCDHAITGIVTVKRVPDAETGENLVAERVQVRLRKSGIPTGVDLRGCRIVDGSAEYEILKIQDEGGSGLVSCECQRAVFG